jgi:hypothetical protein
MLGIQNRLVRTSCIDAAASRGLRTFDRPSRLFLQRISIGVLRSNMATAQCDQDGEPK